MKPAIVADIGNSRMKWGRCSEERIIATAALSRDDPAEWTAQLSAWGFTEPISWAAAGVAPGFRDAFIDWLKTRSHRVAVVDAPSALPLRVDVEKPAAVGIDRLLNAVAANSRRTAGSGAVIVDAGSAVTVDQVAYDGSFLGGAIFPGLRLMSRSLHECTALLPEVEVREPAVMPARSTVAAIRAGVFAAVVGGVRILVDEIVGRSPPAERPRGLTLFLTGGDAPLLKQAISALLASSPGQPKVELWQELTLEGLRLAAEALP